MLLTDHKLLMHTCPLWLELLSADWSQITTTPATACGLCVAMLTKFPEPDLIHNEVILSPYKLDLFFCGPHWLLGLPATCQVLWPTSLLTQWEREGGGHGTWGVKVSLCSVAVRGNGWKTRHLSHFHALFLMSPSWDNLQELWLMVTLGLYFVCCNHAILQSRFEKNISCIFLQICIWQLTEKSFGC